MVIPGGVTISSVVVVAMAAAAMKTGRTKGVAPSAYDGHMHTYAYTIKPKTTTN